MQNGADESSFIPIPLRNKSNQLYERKEMAQVMPILKNLARGVNCFQRFPLLKVLKDMARLFQLSHTQALFFMYLVRETQWGVDDSCVRVHSNGVKDLLCFAHEEPEYKELILYLLLVSYTVKECLNRRQPLLLQRASKICPSFSTAFMEWSASHAKKIQDIHPQLLNRLYMELWSEQRVPSVPDYMVAVDQILEICIPYSEKRVEDNRTRIDKLKREAEHQLWATKPHKLRKMDKNYGGEMCATFREIGQLRSEEYSEDLTDSCVNQLGIHLSGKGRVCLGERVAESESDYCLSLNLAQEDSGQCIFFMRKERDYQFYSTRFFCDDSEPHLL